MTPSAPAPKRTAAFASTQSLGPALALGRPRPAAGNPRLLGMRSAFSRAPMRSPLGSRGRHLAAPWPPFRTSQACPHGDHRLHDVVHVHRRDIRRQSPPVMDSDAQGAAVDVGIVPSWPAGNDPPAPHAAAQPHDDVCGSMLGPAEPSGAAGLPNAGAASRSSRDEDGRAAPLTSSQRPKVEMDCHTQALAARAVQQSTRAARIAHSTDERAASRGSRRKPPLARRRAPSRGRRSCARPRSAHPSMPRRKSPGPTTAVERAREPRPAWIRGTSPTASATSFSGPFLSTSTSLKNARERRGLTSASGDGCTRPRRPGDQAQPEAVADGPPDIRQPRDGRHDPRLRSLSRLRPLGRNEAKLPTRAMVSPPRSRPARAR